MIHFNIRGFVCCFRAFCILLLSRDHICRKDWNETPFSGVWDVCVVIMMVVVVIMMWAAV